MSSDFENLPGAVGSPPEHYGNPLGEQKRLADGSAIVDLSHHGVVTVSGPDRLSWLDSLTSQSIKGMKPGDSSETLQLDINGRLEYAMRVIDDGDTTWLLVDAGEAEGLLAWLTKMRFMLRVELADRSDDFATIGSLGASPIEAAAPGTKRTYLRFADGAWSGCNVFLFATPRSIAALDLWAQVEADRKRPWRIVRRLGVGTLLRYLLGRLTLVQAIAHLGRLAGLDAAAVASPFGLAAVDVDKPADLDLVRKLVAPTHTAPSS